MKTPVAIAALAILTLAAPAQAGRAMQVCRDQNGNPYFTDRGCPVETTVEGRHYVPEAQPYSGRESLGGKASSPGKAPKAVSFPRSRTKSK